MKGVRANILGEMYVPWRNHRRNVQENSEFLTKKSRQFLKKKANHKTFLHFCEGYVYFHPWPG